MKMFFFLVAVVLFCAAGAFGQAISSGPSPAHMLVMTGNPQHAAPTAMAPEQDLRERSGTNSGRGERPLWEFGTERQPISLGQLARDIRKEHEMAKKAVKVWVN